MPREIVIDGVEYTLTPKVMENLSANAWITVESRCGKMRYCVLFSDNGEHVMKNTCHIEIEGFDEDIDNPSWIRNILEYSYHDFDKIVGDLDKTQITEERFLELQHMLSFAVKNKWL